MKVEAVLPQLDAGARADRPGQPERDATPTTSKPNDVALGKNRDDLMWSAPDPGIEHHQIGRPPRPARPWATKITRAPSAGRMN